MNEVKRYGESLRGGVTESITGDWVSFEDYVALKAERDALAAENLALKSAITSYVKVKQDFNYFDGDRRGMAESLCEAEEALISVIKTPATDAYANQLRAEGVAMLRDEFKKHDEQFKVRCDWFISKLLKGNGNG